MNEQAQRELLQRFEFREIRPQEAEEAAEIEQICFPPNEACSREHMLERARRAPELFYVAWDPEKKRIAGYLNGIATHEERLRDEFFTDASLHEKDGPVVMLLGLDVRPEYRRQGLARAIMTGYEERERRRGRRCLVLTCHDEKVDMYRRMGFSDLGMSGSIWGGVAWHEMECRL